MSSAAFCTCVDHACANHPVNHDKGCTPCIAKCLGEREIPSCFFRKVEPDMDRKQDYTFLGFAKFAEERLKHS